MPIQRTANPNPKWVERRKALLMKTLGATDTPENREKIFAKFYENQDV